MVSLSRPVPHGSVLASRRAWTFVAVLSILLLRLLPVETLRPLDGIVPEPSALAQPAPLWARSGEGFPGSAYFLAEDAFAQAAAAPAADAPVTLADPYAGNAHLFQIERGPAALSMILRGATTMDRARALLCMTNALYYEAGNEPEEGQRAIAQVILNRLASGRWPDSVCALVYQGGERADRGCQFTFSCDGSMARTPDAGAWTRARRIAERALDGEVFAPAGLATFYHSLAVHPSWTDRLQPVAVVGAHIFYRLQGEAGAPAAYRMRYIGREYAQPGPYAFAPPPVPPTSAIWSVPDVAPEGAIAQPTMPSLPPARRIVHRDARAVPTSDGPGDPHAPRMDTTPALPQSTVRAEYRNSGRPLH